MKNKPISEKANIIGLAGAVLELAAIGAKRGDWKAGAWLLTKEAEIYEAGAQIRPGTLGVLAARALEELAK